MREKGEGGLPPYTYQHDVNFDLQRVDVKHPVLEGVPSFSVLDETYGRMYHYPDIQPLMVRITRQAYWSWCGAESTGTPASR